MKLLQVDWARKQLVLGLVSTATSGTEDICRAANNAFVSYLQRLDANTHDVVIREVSSIVMEQLDVRATEDDRQVVALLDFLCYMVDQGVFSIEAITESGPNTWDIWAIMMRVHGPTSSLQRIEAALNVYSRLLAIDNCRSGVLDKITRQLLHRWPKVLLPTSSNSL